MGMHGCPDSSASFDFDGDGWDDENDCDPADPAVHPNADDAYGDGEDQDCDGSDGIDHDGDSYPSNVLQSNPDWDCNDFDETVHPGAAEICNATDDDCNGTTDDEYDQDGDGYSTCGADGVADTEDDDCDDLEPAANPGQAEICHDGIDNDCDADPAECALSGTIDLAEAGAKVVGETTNDNAGCALDASGDANGDGRQDLLVGAYRQAAGGDAAGAGYLLHGPIYDTVSLSGADATFIGEAGGDEAGRDIAFAGDVNGDGLSDILVGASYEDSGGADAGAAYLVHGPVTGTVDLADADARLLGHVPGERAGYSVATAGDVDGDGLDDVLVGAPFSDKNGEESGMVYLMLSPLAGTISLDLSAAQLVGVEEDDQAGHTIASAGDLDGDGYGDILVGAWQSDSEGPGRAYLLHGPLSGEQSLADADAILFGESADDDAGVAIGTAGDIDGDGVMDLLVGAPAADVGGSSPGKVYLVAGPTAASADLAVVGMTFTGEVADDQAGTAAIAAGDVDGDGHDDLLVGARWQGAGGDNAGAAYLLYGPVNGDLALAQADAKLVGEEAKDYAGSALAAGDLDGDGFGDLAIGAALHDDPDEDAGAVYLFYGGGL